MPSDPLSTLPEAPTQLPLANIDLTCSSPIDIITTPTPSVVNVEEQDEEAEERETQVSIQEPVTEDPRPKRSAS
eukprot:421027-Rhodomonas_salina.1